MSSAFMSSDHETAVDQNLIQDQFHNLEEQFQNLQKQLWHAQRLASLGTMAAMVAHEYNNLMTPVLSYARYAVDQNDPELMRSALEKVLKQVARARQFSERILNIAADQDRGPISISLRKLVEESLECLGRDLAKDNITLTLEIDPEILVRINPGQMEQVFVNLIQNARQAMLGRRGRLTLSARREGAHALIDISDTGCGIRTEDIAKIFEPFFTTKSRADRPDKRGIGLGLAICRDIVNSHSGDITVESRLGHGTTFTIKLPLAQ